MITDEMTTERFARKLVLNLKGDPDQLVQRGYPTGYGTPSGECFAVTPGAEVPLWRMYISMARELLELARQFDGTSDAPTGVALPDISALTSATSLGKPNGAAA